MSVSRIIRKLSIGKLYDSTCAHYQIGSTIGLKGGDRVHEISRIVLDKNLYAKHGKREYAIWLTNVLKNEEYCWKTVGVGLEAWTEEHDLNF